MFYLYDEVRKAPADTGAALALEEIHSFHSDIRILADSTIDVVEKITVTADGDEIKRGIYRDFPTDYTDPRVWTRTCRPDRSST